MNAQHRRICEAIRLSGGRAMLVGGCVRDALLGIAAQDIDCEVYGLSADGLRALLRRFGEVDESGAAFGVYTLREAGFDFALPRVEKRTGPAHTDFEVTPMPALTAREAAARRDFTVNAIMMDALTGEIVDPYGGQADLAAGVLRAVPGGQFEEDPLRVLRGAQFCARFDLAPDADTRLMMRRMKTDKLSAQRVMAETKKALLGAGKPDVYFRVLREAGALDPWFKTLEGDGFESAMERLGRAAKLRDQAKEPLEFMLAALVLNLEMAQAQAMLTRLSLGERAAYRIAALVGAADAVKAALYQGAGEEGMLLLFDAAADPKALCLLLTADAQEEAKMKPILSCYARYEDAAARPMPTAGMFLDAGIAPGPDLKLLIKDARERVLTGLDVKRAVCETLRQYQNTHGSEAKQ